VKSCVGSTWCRYGVQDSASAWPILVENRYKGLRAPHKLKMAVSGCTRECAEAQSKDVGVIATERGWNLYVCGNGGMKPRHAELFATDLDDATLLRLHRPLPDVLHPHRRPVAAHQHLARQPGRRLDYLKQVLIEDSLGLADELEAQMQHVVDSYQCEWKTAVTTPEVRQRFRTFVNSEQGDQRIVFMPERGQIRPARAEELATDIADGAPV
jgi:nitrite reductase (NADH) large subunit